MRTKRIGGNPGHYIYIFISDEEYRKERNKIIHREYIGWKVVSKDDMRSCRSCLNGVWGWSYDGYDEVVRCSRLNCETADYIVCNYHARGLR